MNSFLSLLILIVITTVAVLLLPQFTKPARWEYRIETPADTAFTREMNGYGSEGWEMVAARRARDDSSFAYEVILKRRLP
jgi:hypothetical protein